MRHRDETTRRKETERIGCLVAWTEGNMMTNGRPVISILQFGRDAIDVCVQLF